jgi:hypothetical protein
MGKDWKYIFYVSIAIGLFVLVKLMAPKQYDWSVTFAHDDKNPYGGYVFNMLLPDIFGEDKVSHSYQTVYELKDSLNRNSNLIVVASNFTGEREDTRALLEFVNKGGHAFISAHYFMGVFADTLNVATRDNMFSDDNMFTQADTAYLKFTNPSLDTAAQFRYRNDNIHNYFERFDTTRTTIIARNKNRQPVTIRIHWGKGNFILNSTPMAFTNIYILSQNNSAFLSNTLSYLPKQNVQWTEYYHLGRMEASTPLRFILTNEPLRWAYFITVIAILAFMIFEAKRKQRIIPVVKPLANTTLEFVATIGNLYYQSGNHKNIAEKKIVFLFEQIRTKYLLTTNRVDENFIRTLSLKSGHGEEQVRSLFKAIEYIQQATMISPEQLIDLNEKIEHFNRR